MFFKFSGSSGFMPVASITTSENFEGCAVAKTIVFPSNEIFFATPIPTAVCGSTSNP